MLNIRQRTSLSLGLTLVGLAVAVLFSSDALLLSSYRDLEDKHSAANVRRAQNALSQEVAKIHGLSPDWSDWDDTYQFMADHNPAYVKANLSVVSIKVDAQLFIDLEGRVFEYRGVDRLPGVRPPDPEEIRHALGFNQPKGRWKFDKQPYSGFVMLSDGPFIVSVRPIRDTGGKAEPRGWLVFGIWLEKQLMAEVAQTAHLDISLLSLDDALSQPAAARAITAVRETQLPFVTLGDEGKILGFANVNDLQGSPVAVLRVTEPREIYAQGSKAVSFFVLFVVLGALVFGVVVYIVLEASVLRRLLSLTSQVEEIGGRVDGTQGVALSGTDELAKLSGQINEMLYRIRDGKQLLELNNESLRRAVDELATTNVALENAVEGIARLDTDGRLVSVNHAFAEAFGTSPSDLTGRFPSEFLPTSVHITFLEALAELGNSRRVVRELEARRNDGSYFFSENVFLPFVDANGTTVGQYWFLRDISDRKVLEVQIQHQAFHDALTGLPNRVLFLDRLTSCMARTARHNEALATIFIDLDNFKIINDTLGHDAGDELLIAISHRLRSCVRPEDTVARLGGDEFTILLGDLTSVQDAVAVADRVIEAMNDPILLKSGETLASASLGIRYSHNTDDTPEDILRDADTAMYRAKSLGKSSYVVFESSMNIQAIEKMEIEAGLRRALLNKEFALAYQPIVELDSGVVAGMEAFLRWHHPDLGLVSPSLFIPVAEETGLIVEIGQWALETACRQTRLWNEKYQSRLEVSVNVAGRQLQAHDSFQVIESILKSTGLEPDLLKLEISEDILLKRAGETIETLRLLKAHGVKIAIDDFGTGYSSLSTLAEHQVDTVKIDRSFIAKLGDNNVSIGVVRAIITLSQTLNLQVTAEGIERWEQLAQLKRLGCSNAQGYMFFAPMNEQDFEDELSTGLLFRRFKVHAA